MKQTETAIAEGNVETAQELCRSLTSLLDRAASKGVIKKGQRTVKSPDLSAKCMPSLQFLNYSLRLNGVG